MLKCVLEPSFACFWALLPAWAQILAIAGTILIVFGVISGTILIVFGICRSVVNFFKSIGGWPAVTGAIAIVLAIGGTILGIGQKPLPTPEPVWDPKKNAPKKPKRPTILDILKKK